MANKDKQQEVTRRNFLKSVGTGIGVATLGGFEVAEASLLPKPAAFEKHDVVVIGTGLSGMVAALSAKSQGADVVVLDKMPQDKSGGSSMRAAGMLAVPADVTQKARDEYYEDFMKKDMGKANAEFTRVLADQSLETVEWLKSQGLDFLPPVGIAGFRLKGAVFAPGLFQGVPKNLAKMVDSFQSKDGKIVFDSKAKQLIMDTNGAVVGVRVAQANGLKDYMAKSVVIASGGYSANKQLLQQWVDPDANSMIVRGVPWATGDGLTMASEAGAALVDFGGMQSIHVAAVSPQNPAAGNPFTAVPYFVCVNQAGKRYIDESLGYVANGKAAIKQPGQSISMIFDEEIKTQPGVATALKQYQALKLSFLEASSLDELAAKIDVPAAALKQTIAEFNASIQDGKALKANPPKTAFAYPIATPKFYAFSPMVPAVTLTFGGIRTNTSAQALEADGRVIPGLYAAGECAGGLFYDDYIGGGSIANCAVFGRIAGREAAGYARSRKK
jgi:flavocytochrome c